MKKWKKFLIGFLVVLAIIVALGLFIIKQNTYSPTKQAEQISQTSIHNKGYDTYTNGNKNNTGLIFYPGALVKPESYSKWANIVAEQGFDVYVVHFPLNIALLNSNAAEKIIKENRNENYILSGHSLGGVAASTFTKKHLDQVKGIIYMASYPQQKDGLENDDIQVLSITASNDGVLKKETYDKAKAYLPKDTIYKVIEGGNHGGFGSYGFQKGDNKATISNEEQQEKIAEIITSWLTDNIAIN